MTALDRRLVDVAVTLSPAAHREVRREQWEADLRDAAELDLSRFGVALGAVTTALFHRRAPHRSTWEPPMTADSLRLPAPHTLTIRTVPLLIVLAFASSFVGIAIIALLGRYTGAQGAETYFWVGRGMLVLVPVILVALAIGCLRQSSRRRRIVGLSLFVALLAAAFGLAETNRLYPSLLTGFVSTAVLAVWFVAANRRGYVWFALLVPVVVASLTQPETSRLLALAFPVLPTSGLALLAWAVQVAPFAGAALGGVVAAAFERRRVSTSPFAP